MKTKKEILMVSFKEGEEGFFLYKRWKRILATRYGGYGSIKKRMMDIIKEDIKEEDKKIC